MPKHHQETTYYNPGNRESQQRNGKVSLITNPPPPEPPKEDETGLLASLNPNLPCCCEVMSRALSDDLPKILGMSDRRAALQFGPDDLLDCNPDIKFDDTGESTTKDSERAGCAKPPKGK